MRHIDVAAQRKERTPLTFKSPFPMRLPMRSEISKRPGEDAAYRKAMKNKKTIVTPDSIVEPEVTEGE